MTGLAVDQLAVPGLRLVTGGRSPRGTGSVRERRPGVWEIRVAVGVDPVTHRTRQRSLTVHGDRGHVEKVRAELVLEAALSLQDHRLPTARLVTVAELLAGWAVAEHGWRPSTTAGNRSIVRTLATDPLLALRVAALTSSAMRATVARWQATGASVAVTSARVRAVRSALGWGYDQRVIDAHPLRFFRGPARCPPRRPLSDEDVRRLLKTATQHWFEAATTSEPKGTTGLVRHHRAELDLLMVRLAADSGARRGELAALRVDDLDGRVLRIERAVSGGEILPPKSGHSRWLTLGAHTATLWHDAVGAWRQREAGGLGPWMFNSDLAHRHRLGAEVLGHRFAAIRDQAGVTDATLHRLRHGVATFLVAHGQALQAQARLGHADAATTLREYAYALPLTDQSVAEAIDQTPRHAVAPSAIPDGRPPSRAAGGDQHRREPP